MFSKKKKIDDIKESYDISIKEIKEIMNSNNFSSFQGLTCKYCTTMHNVATYKFCKIWICTICNKDNTIHEKYRFYPFENPDIGPSNKKIGESLKGDDDELDAENSFYPIY